MMLSVFSLLACVIGSEDIDWMLLGSPLFRAPYGGDYHRDNRGNILFPRQASEWKPKFTPVLPTATTPASVWRTQGHDDHHPHKFYHPIPY